MLRRVAGAWHPGDMSGKEIDRTRAKGAVAVIKQHPGMVLFVASPAIVALGLVWWLFGGGWAFVLLVVLLGAGAAAILRKR
jgi:hypothetical protein